ncbi:DUF922 domain-containing protein [uncultured Maricaulis sp.]|uniref:DUF922 domain-containing protein n=1 Tax=uncultured Maricaulis sp. TaxID=174710 RepID=UPI0030DD9CC1|tara:strand:- start:27497 stop:28123 length:627 start_codon:yes stop_codon:yes gene_type:complete
MGARVVFGLAIALFTIGFCSPASARQAPPEFPHVEQIPVRVDLQFYDVEGRNDRLLNESVQFSGPLGVDADTQTYMSSFWQYQNLDGRCSATVIDIPLDITIRYPHWVGYERASRSRRANWDRRLAVLEAHENGHATLAYAAALDLYNALLAFGRDADCTTFNDEMQAIGDTAMSELQRRQREYDRITRHGLRQDDYDWTPILGPQPD